MEFEQREKRISWESRGDECCPLKEAPALVSRLLRVSIALRWPFDSSALALLMNEKIQQRQAE